MVKNLGLADVEARWFLLKPARKLCRTVSFVLLSSIKVQISAFEVSTVMSVLLLVLFSVFEYISMSFMRNVRKINEIIQYFLFDTPSHDWNNTHKIIL